MTERILVIEDERAIRNLVSEILRDEGYEVTGAADGEKALSILAENPDVDLVILDMWMPVLNGWQFVEALAKRDIQLPIVVMTAAQDARKYATEVGAVGYISKPFDINAFVETVRKTLKHGGWNSQEVRSAWPPVMRPLMGW